MSDEQDIIVSIDAVSKSYWRGNQPVPVLEGITFDISRGAFLALMGPSGSGKSTLLNLIAGIDTVDSGSIRVDGIDIATLPEADLAAWRAANVGFIFQFYNLIPVLTAYENVELPLLLTSLYPSRASRTCRDRAGRCQSDRSQRTLSFPAFRRSAAACGNRPCHRDRSDYPGGRRAHRGS